MTKDSQPAPYSRRLIILFLGTLSTLTPFTIDLYLPAFADIAMDLGTNVQRVSLSVATYFIGFALGQLIYGPLLDRFGRKPPIYFGLTLYIFSTIGCMTAQSIEALLIFRFLSALGGSSAAVGSITMVRDYFEAKDSARVFSMLMLVLSVSPLFAPTIGGWIASHFGWRVIFGSLIGFAGVVVLIVTFGLPKVYKADKKLSLNLFSIFKTFVEIFKVRQFRTYTMAGAFSFSGLFVYLTGSPSIYIDGFQVSKQMYGLIFALLAVGMIGGGQVNNFLIRKYDSALVFRRAVICQVMISFTFLIVLLSTELSLVPTTLFLFVILLCTGIGYPNAASLALAPITKNVGSASSLLGFMQMGAGALLASLVGLMDVEGTLPTVVVMALSSVLAVIILAIGKQRKA